MTGASVVLLVPLGVVFSQDVLASGAFQFLAAFVAVNTIMYVALAVAKMLPKVYLSDLRAGRSRRSETRSIHPGDADAREQPPPGGGDGADVVPGTS